MSGNAANSEVHGNIRFDFVVRVAGMIVVHYIVLAIYI